MSPFFPSIMSRQLLCVLIVGSFGIPMASAQTPSLAELVDQVVDVRIQGNLQYTGCTIIKAAEGKTPGSIKNLKVRPAGTQKTRGIPVNKVVEIFLDGQPLDVAYDRKTRSLSRSDDVKKERLAWENEINQRLSPQRRRLWRPLTAAQHESFMDLHREFLDETRSQMKNVSFRYIETGYFMFLTDLSPEEVDGLIVYLDSMYSELCKAFGIPPTHNIWCGKCVVVAFRDQQNFLTFEQVMMKNDATGAQGICHGLRDGRVIFAGYQGRSGFPNVLVHETSHGFVHRYLSSARVPSWLNEGIADWIGHEIVKSERVPRRRKSAALLVKQAGTLGDFFQAAPIDGKMYGVASTLVEILIQRDRGNGKFKEFFDGIKMGEDPEQSLKESFGLTYQELTILYARAIGMNRIR